MLRSLDFFRNTERAVGYGRVGAEVADLLDAREVILTPSAPTRLICTNIAGIDGWWSHQRRVMWTMWETDRLPESYHGQFDDIDTLLVPCHANVEAFSEHHRDVRLMPLGVNVDRWRPVARTLEGPFIVMAGGRGWERKGIDLAITTFLNALEGEDAELWLRVEGRIEQDPRLAHPQIKMIPRVADELPLYAQVHVFLALARGEGFGLMPAQAICQGIPTILTDAHGHREFSSFGWGVEARKVPAGFGGLGDPGMWWEADVDEATGCLTSIYQGYDNASAAAWQLADVAREHLAWDIDRLLHHLELGPPVDRGVWMPHREPRGHEIRVQQPVRCDIAGRDLQFVPGETYHDSWNVKNVLHLNGSLDESLWSPSYREVVVR